jgi:gamma-glutamylaminecyclotransferase
MPDYVFVYGTLKTGLPNFDINQGEKITGNFVTLKYYPLLLIGNRYSPWMIDDPGRGIAVKGEVFRVNQQQLARLDKLERIHKADGYQRKSIQVMAVDGHKILNVFAYFKSKQQVAKNTIKMGPIEDYNEQLAHLYIPRH